MATRPKKQKPLPESDAFSALEEDPHDYVPGSFEASVLFAVQQAIDREVRKIEWDVISEAKRQFDQKLRFEISRMLIARSEYYDIKKMPDHLLIRVDFSK